MQEWLDWARGPAFRFALAFMLLGLLRLLSLHVAGLVSLRRRAGGRAFPLGRVVRDTLRWLLPIGHRSRPPLVLTAVSMLFHVAVIVTPVFLSAHVLLWRRGLGVGWPALGQVTADLLAVLGLLTAGVLLAHRLWSRAARTLSRGQDYVLLLLVMAVFASGFLAAHPAGNPLSYDATMLVHVLAGDVLLVFVPFSKLAHVVLFPTTQLVSELGWHLAPGSGRAVAVALGKEDEPL